MPPEDCLSTTQDPILPTLGVDLDEVDSLHLLVLRPEIKCGGLHIYLSAGFTVAKQRAPAGLPRSRASKEGSRTSHIRYCDLMTEHASQARRVANQPRKTLWIRLE